MDFQYKSFDNVSSILKDDLQNEIKKGAKLSIAYENRNKNVLVLCPQKLSDNWTTYKENYVNNPIASDRLHYDVLYHTDLSRAHGISNGLNLAKLNWSNYDLIVIDESHNFRNGGQSYLSTDGEQKDNRYNILFNKVIRKGVRTKVLMLSETPGNNQFIDLKDQLALVYEGNAGKINKKLGDGKNIDHIFREVQIKDLKAQLQEMKNGF